MKARFSYPLVFLLPCAMASIIAAVFFGAAAGGVLWLFVYGDNSWPEASGTVVLVLASLVAAAVLAALLSTCYSIGKRQESFGGLRKRHVAIAVAVTALLPALVILNQWQVGNIAPKDDILVCADFCTARKFNSFKFPRDGTCRCYNSGGQEATNVHMDRARESEG